MPWHREAVPPSHYLVPRFPLSDLEEGVSGWERVADCLQGLDREQIGLHGPHWPEADLCWYDYEQDQASCTVLQEAHNAALLRAGENDLIISPPHFSGTSYHPHLTIAWRHDGELPSLPTYFAVRPVAIAIYAYDKDPHAGAVIRRVVREFEGN